MCKYKKSSLESFSTVNWCIFGGKLKTKNNFAPYWCTALAASAPVPVHFLAVAFSARALVNFRPCTGAFSAVHGEYFGRAEKTNRCTAEKLTSARPKYSPVHGQKVGIWKFNHYFSPILVHRCNFCQCKLPSVQCAQTAVQCATTAVYVHQQQGTCSDSTAVGAFLYVKMLWQQCYWCRCAAIGAHTLLSVHCAPLLVHTAPMVICTDRYCTYALIWVKNNVWTSISPKSAPCTSNRTFNKFHIF